MVMHTYQVGQPYNPGRTRWPEAAQYNYRSGAHELLLCFRRITARERHDVRRGPAEFALTIQGPIIFLLYRFGESVPWSDAPYTIHLVPEDERASPAHLDPGQGVLLHTILVNADNGLVEALRVVSLSPHFSTMLHDAIRIQMNAPFDQPSYDAALDDVYRRYPGSDDLLTTALARCHGGD